MAVVSRQSSVGSQQSSALRTSAGTLTRSQQLGLVIVTVLFVGYVFVRLLA